MFNLGAGEIVVILLLALIFLGPSKLPDLATGLGKLIREIRKATADVKNEITIDDSFRKPFEELRDAVTLPPEELKRRDQIKRSVEEARKRAEAEAARAAAAQAAELAAAAAAPTEAALAAPAPTAPVEPAAPTQAAEAGEAEPATAPTPATVAPPGTVARGQKPTSGPESPAVEQPGLVQAAAATASGPPEAPAGAAMVTPAAPPTGASRVTPPVSSLAGERANVTQSLSEADLLASVVPPSRPAPPPLPGLDRTTHTAPLGRAGLPRVTPPISSAGGDRANATQILSESDLLPPGTPPRPPGAVKPPSPPGSKKA